MKRRNILMGIGGIAAGSGALVGSGAFTSVQANRNVAVAIVDDPKAYLALGSCEGSPNGQYARIQDNGTMAIDLSPSNENILGEGVNPDAFTVIRDMFQIKNQGTQEAAVWIDVDPVEDDNGEDRVEFYLHEQELDENENAKIVGYDNRVCLDVGDSVCVSMDIDTRGLGSDFENEDGVNNLMKKLGDSDNEMIINAVADECPVEEPEPEPEPTPDGNLYGVGFDDNLYEIEITGEDSSSSNSATQIGGTAGDASVADYSPNGLATGPGVEVGVAFYYSTNANQGNSQLWSYDPSSGDNDLGTLNGTSYGAGWYDGAYYYVANGAGELRKVTVSFGGIDNDELVTDLEEDYTMGDLAIDDDGLLYASTNNPAEFFKIDLDANNPGEDNLLDGSWGPDDPTNLQLGFDTSGTLYGHDTSDETFYRIDLDNNEVVDLGTVDDEEGILKFTDLANGRESQAPSDIVDGEPL